MILEQLERMVVLVENTTGMGLYLIFIVGVRVVMSVIFLGYI